MPDWPSELRDRLARLELAPAREATIVEELATHLADRYSELRDRGFSAEAAEAQVRAEHLSDAALALALAPVEPRAAPPAPPLGAEGPSRHLAGFFADLRFAARSLRKSPGLVAVALLTLALSIGANTAIFSTVHAVLLQRPPFHDPDRLVTFWGTAPEKRLPVVNYPDGLYDWYRGRVRSVDPIAMYSGGGFTLTGDGEPERLLRWGLRLVLIGAAFGTAGAVAMAGFCEDSCSTWSRSTRSLSASPWLCWAWSRSRPAGFPRAEPPHHTRWTRFEGSELRARHDLGVRSGWPRCP